MMFWPKSWVDCFLTTQWTLVVAALVLTYADHNPDFAGLSAVWASAVFALGYVAGVCFRRLRDDTRYQYAIVASFAAIVIGVLSQITSSIR